MRSAAVDFFSIMRKSSYSVAPLVLATGAAFSLVSGFSSYLQNSKISQPLNLDVSAVSWLTTVRVGLQAAQVAVQPAAPIEIEVARPALTQPRPVVSTARPKKKSKSATRRASAAQRRKARAQAVQTRLATQPVRQVQANEAGEAIATPQATAVDLLSMRSAFFQLRREYLAALDSQTSVNTQSRIAGTNTQPAPQSKVAKVPRQHKASGKAPARIAKRIKGPAKSPQSRKSSAAAHQIAMSAPTEEKAKTVESAVAQGAAIVAGLKTAENTLKRAPIARHLEAQPVESVADAVTARTQEPGQSVAVQTQALTSTQSLEAAAEQQSGAESAEILRTAEREWNTSTAATGPTEYSNKMDTQTPVTDSAQVATVERPVSDSDYNGERARTEVSDEYPLVNTRTSVPTAGLVTIQTGGAIRTIQTADSMAGLSYENFIRGLGTPAVSRTNPGASVKKGTAPAGGNAVRIATAGRTKDLLVSAAAAPVESNSKETPAAVSDSIVMTHSGAGTSWITPLAHEAFSVPAERVGATIEVISTEGLEVGNHPRWAHARAEGHWPTLAYVKGSEAGKPESIPVVSDNTVKILGAISGVNVESNAGIVYGKIAAGWTVDFSGRAESVIYLDNALSRVAEEDTSADRHFIYTNAAPGGHLLYGVNRADGRSGAVALPVRPGKVTYIDMSRPESVTLRGEVMDASSTYGDGIPGVHVRILGHHAAGGISDSLGRVEIDEIVAFSPHPVYIEAADQDGHKHRYQLRPAQLDGASLFYFSGQQIKRWISSIPGGVSPQSGMIVAAVPALGPMARAATLYPVVTSIDESTLSAQAHVIRRDGQVQPRGALDSALPRVLGTQVSDGFNLLEVRSGDRLVWSELIRTSPGVINVVGP